MRFKSLKSITLGKQKKKTEKEKNDDKFKTIASNHIADMEKRIHGRTKELEKKAQQIKELSPDSDISETNGDIPRPHGPLSELTLEDNELNDDTLQANVVAIDDSDDDEGEDSIKLVEVSTASAISQDNEGKANETEVGEDKVAEASAAVPNLLEKETGAQETQPAEAKATTPDSPEKKDGEEAEEAPSAEAAAAPSDTAEKEEEIKLDDDGDSLNNLFDDEEEEENPLANLIKSLPDVSAQEIIDDLNEIKGIIKEWQKK